MTLYMQSEATKLLTPTTPAKIIKAPFRTTKTNLTQRNTYKHKQTCLNTFKPLKQTCLNTIKPITTNIKENTIKILSSMDPQRLQSFYVNTYRRGEVGWNTGQRAVTTTGT